jgi:hypothetical protein
MKYTVEKGSGVMIYIPSFIKIDSAFQKLIWWGYADKQTTWRSHKPAIIFFLKKKGK